MIFRVMYLRCWTCANPDNEETLPKVLRKDKICVLCRLGAQEIGVGSASGAFSRGVACGNIWDMIWGGGVVSVLL